MIIMIKWKVHYVIKVISLNLLLNDINKLDPGVMGAALNLYLDILKKDNAPLSYFKDLTSSFIVILK